MGPKLDQLVDFDIDTYLNSFVPISCLSYLPKSISRFLGYRDEAYKEPARLIVYVWLLFGTISSLLSIGALLRFAPGLSKYHPPVIFASLGASAILDFNAIRTPLAQPRNAFFGQVLSAIIGVAITKGFQQVSDFADLQWIAVSSPGMILHIYTLVLTGHLGRHLLCYGITCHVHHWDSTPTWRGHGSSRCN